MEWKRRIACCGIDCSECGAFVATKNDDDAKRKEVAAEWSRTYGKDIRPEDIRCDGCMTEGGVLFGYCHVCEIRKCVGENGFPNCAHCPDYPCDSLEKFLRIVPDAGTRLNTLRQGLP